MSSILKALKRLEHQRGVRGKTDHDLSWFVGDGAFQPGKKRVWPMIAAVAAVAGVSALSTYWLMRGADKGSPVPPPSGVSAPGPAEPDFVRSPTRAYPVPGERYERPPESVAGKPVPASRVPQAESAAPRSAVKGIPCGEGDVDPLEATQVAVRERLRATPARRANTPPPETSTSLPTASLHSLPSLNVTGIAWQNDGQVRLAVVNGRSVTEGSMIDGAVVEKITPDRVSFSYRDRTFDVPLGEGSVGR